MNYDDDDEMRAREVGFLNPPVFVFKIKFQGIGAIVGRVISQFPFYTMGEKFFLFNHKATQTNCFCCTIHAGPDFVKGAKKNIYIIEIVPLKFA